MANLIHRFRLRFVWLLTRHPRFRPLYHADVAAFDPIGQAEFLASAGYYVAAAMLCRMAIEQRMKCLALLSPRWHELNRKQPGNYGYFLLSQGLIGSNVKQKYECSTASRARSATATSWTRSAAVMCSGRRTSSIDPWPATASSISLRKGVPYASKVEQIQGFVHRAAAAKQGRLAT